MKLCAIAKASQLTGLTPHTLRYYERVGLLNPIIRDKGRQRLFSEQDLLWIAFLQRLRETGMSIRAMQQYAELRRQGDSSLLARQQLLQQHLEQVLQKRLQLNQNIRLLKTKIETYDQFLHKQPK
jgi:DNA-binding transcriptional MerR regulator